MTFWIITIALAIIVAVIIAAALFGTVKGAFAPAMDHDLRVYRDQLKEIERDLARGALSAKDAEPVRAEVSRRILAADAARGASEVSGPVQTGPTVVAGAFAVLLIGASFAMYQVLGAPGYGDLALKTRIAQADDMRKNRPSQSEAEASLPATTPDPNASAQYDALVAQLRATVADRPDDLQGHILLATSEANLGNYAQAAKAQAQVLRIKAEDATVSDIVDYADLLVIAAGGYVSPEAEAVLRTALSRDDENGIARYYLGAMMAQTGRPDVAFRMWDQLLRRGPKDAPWIAPIVAEIGQMAERAGVNYQLPEIGGDTRGPDAGDVEAAQDMSPAQRMEMIEGMVAGLSERLATEGGPVQDWAQLIGALGVLGRTAQARAIYENATEVFAADLPAMDLLLRAGQRAGVAE
ncbi:MAG: c-type cytochrome biogenesis protein CcmI [Sulfitobacter sp.]